MQDAWYTEFSLLSDLIVLPVVWVDGAVDWAVCDEQRAEIHLFSFHVSWLPQTRILHRGYGWLKPPFRLFAIFCM